MADTGTLTVNVPITCLNCQTTLHLPMNANTNRAWIPNPHLAWLWLWANAHQGPIRILDPT